MIKEYEEYVVGGYVRDEILGVESKDIDYAFEFKDISKFKNADEAFKRMEDIIREKGKIFLSTPECFTIRYIENETTLIKDVVMCRKETYPDPNSRKPHVEIGTLVDDLSRRDFTVNAIAKNEMGMIIDPFRGYQDIKDKILRCTISAQISFNDDPLRILRGLRFSLTKGFKLDWEMLGEFQDRTIWEKFDRVVSRERVREELQRMFKFDTLGTIDTLNKYLDPYVIKNYIFKDDIWLKPTTEKR